MFLKLKLPLLCWQGILEMLAGQFQFLAGQFDFIQKERGILISLLFVGGIICWLVYSLRQKLRNEKLLNAFATSLYGQNTVEDIFWDTAKNCVQKLGFVDCVMYILDESRGTLVQKAAFGPKNPRNREIYNRIEIPVGKGIVGAVARSGKAELIGNTDKDPRYLLDDDKRLSEITVPLFVNGKLFGIIDSEHPQRNFFTRSHLRLLKKVASICSACILKYLGEEKLRNKIARDLHDEIGSTLTSINIISKVAMQPELEKDRVNYYLQKIKDSSARMMESMSDIVWAINPANDKFEQVIVKMKEFAAELFEPARISYHFTEEGPLEEVQLNPEQRKDMFMIFKEALNNIVKYSCATEAHIQLQKNDHCLQMRISDNGIGFDMNRLSSGNGLKNMKSRAKEINAVLRVESIKSKGCSVFLELTVP